MAQVCEAWFRCGSVVCGTVLSVVVKLWFRCVWHGSVVVQLWLICGVQCVRLWDVQLWGVQCVRWWFSCGSVVVQCLRLWFIYVSGVRGNVQMWFNCMWFSV